MRAVILFLILSPFFLPVFFSGCGNNNSSGPPSDQVYASLSDSARYVGINTCRQCHSQVYETFIRTGMGSSFDVASRKKSSAVFGSHAIFRDTVKNFFYHPYWNGDSMFVEEFRIEGTDTVYKRTERVSYIVGSGQHTNSHMMDINGYVTQIPATYYTQKKTWDLPPGFEGKFNSRFSRKIELECMSCHNAYPQMVAGSENKFDFIANGIDCERCHGPGSLHVFEKSLGKIVDTAKYIDYTIVNPAKLPINLQLDVCQRCHIQGNAVLKAGKSFLDFRPGMHLSDVMNVFMPVYSGAENEHIMASHVERMKMSACFRISAQEADKLKQGDQALYPYRNAMTCVTCHNPHVSVKETGVESFNQKCRNCHTGKNQTHPVCTAPVARRMKSGDNCVSCHMPRGGSIDIPHVITTDHFIRIPVTPKEKSGIREFIRLACINNNEVDKTTRGEAFLSFYEKFTANSAFLDSAGKYLAHDSEENIVRNIHLLIRWAYLREDYTALLDFVSQYPGIMDSLYTVSSDNRDAWTAYRIATAFQKTGDLATSLLYFSKAVKLAPYILDFRDSYASLLMDAGNYTEAEKQLLFVLKEYSRDASAFVSYGYLLLLRDRNIHAADSMYNIALALDPDYRQALINKCGTLVLSGRRAEAGKMLKELEKKFPGDPEVNKMTRAFNR